MRQENFARQCGHENGNKHQDDHDGEQTNISAIEADPSRSVGFAPSADDHVKNDQEQDKNEFDVQPEGVDVILTVGHDQQDSTQNREEGTRISQPAEPKLLDPGQARARLWEGFAHMS